MIKVSLGKIYPVGYADPTAPARIERLMQENKRIAIIDIRLRPYSRWYTTFNKNRLQEKYGHIRYMHIEDLGNLNHATPGAPIQLKAPEEPIAKLVRCVFQGWSLIILCACKDYHKCHRKTVVNLLKECMPEVEVVLPEE